MNKFSVNPPRIDDSGKVVFFNYEVFSEKHSGEFSFTEKVEFPFRLDLNNKKAISCLLDRLAVLIGISYYKAFCLELIEINIPLSYEVDIPFLKEVFVKGLGEFAYRNKIKEVFHTKFEITLNNENIEISESLNLDEGVILPIGGGKDSLVSLEVLKAAKVKIIPFVVNKKPVIQDCITLADLNGISVKRKIDPQLIELNKTGVPNGHIPITAINSFIACISALATNNKYVSFSNERSASEENLTWNSVAINHQYSKSIEFERNFRDYLLRLLGPELEYFSLLRPMSELAIAKAFAKVETYDGVFSSCNRSFKIIGSESGWCLNCPKCRFVFLCLAPFMKKQRLLDIFKGNLLADKSQEDGFKELLGFKGNKPWECVGEIDECRVALFLLSSNPEWRNEFLVKSLIAIPMFDAKSAESNISRYFGLADDHCLNPVFFNHLKNYVVQ